MSCVADVPESLSRRDARIESARSGLRGENVICFAKDWNEEPTSNNHVMSELARHNRVLWLNSVSTRTPKLTSKRDIKKIFAKMAKFVRGAEEVKPNLWVYTPLVIPLPHSRVAAVLNRWILRLTLRMLRSKLGMKEFQLWTFLPNVGPYVGTLGESLSVYYCTDEWSKFTYVDGEKTAAAERQLISRAGIVFATAKSLVDARKKLNPRTYLARHGVDHDLFSAALSDETPVPQDLRTIAQPIIGFYGTIQDWIDFDLIEYLASRHPEWSLVLIGKALVDVSRLERLGNVHLLGRRPHGQLPNYCKGFAVGIIPYVLNERILHVNPIKLREYLSAGVPVVSVAMPEVSEYAGLCATADTYPEFERAIDEALRTDSPQKRVARSHAVAGESWERKVRDLAVPIEQLKASKA